MNMKKYILPAVQTALLVSILTVLLILYRNDRVSREQLISQWEDEHFIEQVYMENNMVAAALTNGLPISLGDSIVRSPQIVCYYSAQSCAACINYAKKAIQNFFPNSPNDSTVLFVTRNFPANYSFKEKNTLNLGTRKLNLPIEEVDRVFYFVIEKSRIEHVFMPERQFDEYTQTYLKQIAERYVK